MCVYIHTQCSHLCTELKFLHQIHVYPFGDVSALQEMHELVQHVSRIWLRESDMWHVMLMEGLGPTYWSGLLRGRGGLLPPLVWLISRSLHRGAAVIQRSANRNLSLSSSHETRRTKFSLTLFPPRWDPQTEAGPLSSSPRDPQPWTGAHRARSASLDIYASRCCGSCTLQERSRHTVSGEKTCPAPVLT